MRMYRQARSSETEDSRSEISFSQMVNSSWLPASKAISRLKCSVSVAAVNGFSIIIHLQNYILRVVRCWWLSLFIYTFVLRMKNLKELVFVILLLSGTNIFAQTKKLVPFKISGDENRWGYKDSLTDKVFIYWHFDEAAPFNENGYARVTIGGYQTFIDTNGNLLFPFVFRSLPSALKDTLVIDAEKNVKLIKQGNNYWEYKKGKRRFDYPVSEYLGAGISNFYLRVYDFSNAKTVKELKESLITQRLSYSIKDNMELTVSYGKITDNPKKWVDADVLHIQCMNFLNNNNKMRGLAAGAGYYNARLTSDSFSYRVNLITFGIMQRISFGSEARVSIDIGIHPILSRRADFRAVNVAVPGIINTTNGPWKNFDNSSQSIKAITELGFMVKISELFRAGLAMRGIPTGINTGPASQTILLKASFCW